MSLPFLKRKQVAGLIVQNRKPDEVPSEDSQDPSDHMAALEACSQDIIDAIHSRDAKKLADSLRSAFEWLELMPHEEGPHPEGNDYDSRNEAAAKESE